MQTLRNIIGKRNFTSLLFKVVNVRSTSLDLTVNVIHKHLHNLRVYIAKTARISIILHVRIGDNLDVQFPLLYPFFLFFERALILHCNALRSNGQFNFLTIYSVGIYTGYISRIYRVIGGCKESQPGSLTRFRKHEARRAR